ncbi:MAG: hypothetical protein WD359_09960 [Dehalococcoidia bacterium]
MCLIRLITGSILGLLFGALTTLLVIVLAFSALSLLLATTGGPEPCEPRGGPLVVDDAQAASFQQKWNEFQTTLDMVNAGQTVDPARFVAFTESEISSRANEYVEGKHIPIDDIRVCLDEGYGVGTGTVSILGFDTKVRLKGTVEFTDDSARPRIDDMEIGSVPGFMSAPIRRLVNRQLDRAAVDVVNAHNYQILIGNGNGAVAGTAGE